MSVEIIKERPPYVTFEMRAVEDRAATIDSGCYVAKDVAYACITPQGSKDRIERVAEEWLEQLKQQVSEGRFQAEWLEAYIRMYRAWKEGQELPLEGTPIRNWPAASPAQVKMLVDLHLLTVEDLAAANEETISRMGMGGRALKSQAVAWLESSSDTGKVAQEVAALRAANADLAQRNKDLEERLARLEAASQDKPGKKL